MKAIGHVIFAAVLAIGPSSWVAAQELNDIKPSHLSAPATQGSAASINQPRVLTGKERLGPKWTDEQRVDNCQVPPDKRGPKPRPSACAQSASGF